MKNKEKIFTAGISYKEHLTKAQEVFDNIVVPEVQEELRLEEEQTEFAKPVLNSAQKAHLNCQNPI